MQLNAFDDMRIEYGSGFARPQYDPKQSVTNFQQNTFLIIRISPNSSCIQDGEKHAVNRIIIEISNVPIANQLANLVIHKQ